jgi:hypothetical protein
MNFFNRVTKLTEYITIQFFYIMFITGDYKYSSSLFIQYKFYISSRVSYVHACFHFSLWYIFMS